jgi:hypothetical protein
MNWTCEALFLAVLAPSESVWRAAGTFISGTKSGTQTMYTFTRTALLNEAAYAAANKPK